MSDEERKTCEQCTHCKPISESEGQCRFFPPTPVYFEGKVRAQFPVVDRKFTYCAYLETKENRSLLEVLQQHQNRFFSR